MIPPEHRLADRRVFERAFSEGVSFSFGSIALRCLSRNDRNPSRIGFVVGKKKVRRAIDRNRIRRQLRACMGKFISNIVPGYDIVVLYRSNIVKTPSSNIQTHLERALLTSNVLPRRVHFSNDPHIGRQSP